MTLNLNAIAQLTGGYQKVAGQGGSSFTLNYQGATVTFADGVAAGQVDILYRSIGRVLVASTGEDLDLAAVLLDVLGTVFTMVKLKLIEVFAYAANTNNVVIGNGTNPFLGWFGAAAHTIALQPGGSMRIVAPNAGYTVTPATADIIKVLNGGAGTSVTYDVTIAGTSA